MLNENQWAATCLEDFTLATEKLITHASRFEDAEHESIGNSIITIIKDLQQPSGAAVSSEQIITFNELISQLSQLCIRKEDDQEDHNSIPLRKHIYIALNDNNEAKKIHQQLTRLGFKSQCFDSPDEFNKTLAQRTPSLIVMDVNFGGENHSGIELLSELQKNRESPITIIFYSHEDNDITTRLEASRANGCSFYVNTIDVGQLVEEIEYYSDTAITEPYRVLILDDSRSQVLATSRTLNNSGMVTRQVTDPMAILDEIEDFQPEIMIIDMYMPGCTGTEIARVIRQQKKYDSIPIIFLSAEEDTNKQLQAMRQGGDDFLTKPIKADHLIAAVQNRGERSRSLFSLMVRDSLTGLYNHTHILQQLDKEIIISQRINKKLCFAMLDIDNFKQVNDNYGHPAGDRVLKSLSFLLKQRLRKSDSIGRYGGEEFAIVLPNTNLEEANNIMSDILERFACFAHPFNDTEFNTSFSCGIAAYSNQDVDTLINQADQALYKAKDHGRNQIQLYQD